MKWPPLPTVARLQPLDDARRLGVRVAGSLAVLCSAFFGGWFVAGGSGSGAADLFVPEDEQSAAAEAASTEGIAYGSHADAAIGAALGDEPGLVDPRVTRAVVISADETTVDLRVEVQAQGYCQWFGVVGRVDGDHIAWRAASALGCED